MCGCAPCGGTGGGRPGPRPRTPSRIDESRERRRMLPYGQALFVDSFGESTGRGVPRMFLVKLSGISVEAGTPPADEVEDAHVAHLGELQRDGHLHFVAHDHAGTEGFMLLSAPSDERADELVREDPLVESAYYSDVEIIALDAPYPQR